jgi:hypothetical protein
MSTEFLGSSDMILNEKAIAEFYIHTYNQLVKTELGRNPNQEFANLPVVAIQQFKIPQKTLVGIKGQITQALNGYSTMFSIECLNPLFSGARDLQEAQLILQKVIKENGLKVERGETKDVICVKFNQDSRGYEKEKEHWEYLIKNKQADFKILFSGIFMLNSLYSTKNLFLVAIFLLICSENFNFPL